MNGEVTLDEVDTVRRHVSDALAASSPRSTLSDDEQDALLAQACSEACDILDRWVNSPAWEEMQPRGEGPIADFIPDWVRVRPFLVPVGATLNRLNERHPGVSGLPEIGDPDAYIDQIIKHAESTGRRYRRFSQEALFEQATQRIRVLQSSVCGVAADFAKGAKTRARRRSLARSALKAVGGFLLSAALILGGITPQALAHDVPEWGHEAVKVLFVHNAAQTAQPAVRVAPPALGPHLSS